MRYAALAVLVLLLGSTGCTRASPDDASLASPDEDTADSGQPPNDLSTDQTQEAATGRTVYEAAFESFRSCVADNAGQLVGVQRHPQTGQFDYAIPDRGDNVEIVDDCYWSEFQAADAEFQTTDPAVLAIREQENLEFLVDVVIPCLVKNDVDVPDSVGPELVEDAAFMRRWAELSQSGSC